MISPNTAPGTAPGIAPDATPEPVVFVALTAPGEAASVRTPQDALWWLYPACWSFFLAILLFEIFVPLFGVLILDIGIWIVSGVALVTVTVGIHGLRFHTIRIRDGVVHGVTRNGFGIVLDRWRDGLNAYRVTPTRILRHSRVLVDLMGHEDGPIEAMGAAELRMEHVDRPERTVTLLRQDVVPTTAPLPFDAEAAQYAAHLQLPVGAMATDTEIHYPRPASAN